MDHNGGRMLPIASAICAAPLSLACTLAYPVPPSFPLAIFPACLSPTRSYPSPSESPSGGIRSTPAPVSLAQQLLDLRRVFAPPNVRALEPSDPRASPLPDSTTRARATARFTSGEYVARLQKNPLSAKSPNRVRRATRPRRRTAPAERSRIGCSLREQ